MLVVVFVGEVPSVGVIYVGEVAVGVEILRCLNTYCSSLIRSWLYPLWLGNHRLLGIDTLVCVYGCVEEVRESVVRGGGWIGEGKMFFWEEECSLKRAEE